MIRQTRPSLTFNESERREIIEEYLKGGKTKVEIWRQYTGYEEEHGQLLRWMRQLGYIEKPLRSRPLSLPIMSSNKPQPSVDELQKKVKQLEQQLLDSQLKEEAYKRMIDIAEKELKVSIRKKPNTK
jgi:transposase-like protein